MHNYNSKCWYFNKIFGRYLNVSTTLPGTCWFINPKQRDFRVDELFTFTRNYHRPTRTYAYTLVIGRLRICCYGESANEG